MAGGTSDALIIGTTHKVGFRAIKKMESGIVRINETLGRMARRTGSGAESIRPERMRGLAPLVILNVVCHAVVTRAAITRTETHADGVGQGILHVTSSGAMTALALDVRLYLKRGGHQAPVVGSGSSSQVGRPRPARLEHHIIEPIIG